MPRIEFESQSPEIVEMPQETPPPATSKIVDKPQTERYRPLFEGIPILGVTGINGAGKTLAAVQIALGPLSKGRPVYSTVPIDHPQFGQSLPISSMRQLLEMEDVTVLLDDVAVIFSSRSSRSLPDEVITWLQVIRHRRINVIWTAPSWMNADVNLRRVTQACVNVMPMFRARVPGSYWPRPRLVGLGLLDTHSLPVDARPDRVLSRKLRVPRRLQSWGAYDTHAGTPQIGRAAEGGACPICGGRRDVPRCSTDRHREMGLDERGMPLDLFPDHQHG